MTYRLGRTSKARLATCHEDIQAIVNLAITKTTHDFFVAEGYRPKEKQDECFQKGSSKVLFPKSFHNSSPSLAVDVVPYKGGAVWGCETFEETQAWKEVERAIKESIEILNFPLQWGFDMWGWDKPHWQLTSYRK